MTDNEVIQALEYCSDEGRKDCKNCPIYKVTNCFGTLSGETVDLINRLQAENDDLFYKLTGVMHSVDKWLDGDELKQDEVNRAATMREKTLQIVEKQQAEIERLTKETMNMAATIETCQCEAIKEFAEKCKKKLRTGEIIMDKSIRDIIDNLVKEMVGEE